VLNFLKSAVDDASANQRAKVSAIYIVLLAASALVWIWALVALAGRPTLLGTAFLAYVLGLRHAVDADHIATIDNVVRKLMQEGKRPYSVGLFFSLGHSLSIALAVAAIAAAAETVRSDAEDINVDVMNLPETPIDTCDGRPLDGYGAETRQAVGRIAAAAAVLIAAPVYRASFAGVLKNLLDIVPVEALQGKPVGIVAMGGSTHHYLAVDAQLRQVLGWFGALVAPTGVYLTGADFHDGALTSESARKDLVALADTLLMLLRRLDPALLGPPPLAAKFT